MTSRFSARVEVDAGDKSRAIFDSISADNSFYPENPTVTRIRLDAGAGKDRGRVLIEIDSGHLPHLRAHLNSTLRLVWACDDAVESVKI